MPKYKVVEIFESINGEGKKAGQLALFIRFQYCNLNCSYCDTKWANSKNSPFTWMSLEEILSLAKEKRIKNITLTGGEPLLQPDVLNLLEAFAKEKQFEMEIETNGSVPLEKFRNLENPQKFLHTYLQLVQESPKVLLDSDLLLRQVTVLSHVLELLFYLSFILLSLPDPK